MAGIKKPLVDEALTGNTSKNGSSDISGFGSRVERYSTAKANQYKILNYLRDESSNHPASRVEKLKESLGGCGNYLVFHQYSNQAIRLGKASFCKKHFLCQLCAIRRGCKQVESYVKKLDCLLLDNPILKPFLLTLTVKNGESLKERYEHLSSSMKRLMQKRRDYLKKGTPSEFGKSLGGVYSYEFTKSKHGWHPHVHMVVLLGPDELIDFPFASKPPKISAEDWKSLSPAQKAIEKNKRISWGNSAKGSGLSGEWKKITGDSGIVDIRPIEGDVALGFVEVFKYALKFSELSSKDNIDAYFELMNSSGSMPRFTGSFGLLWGVKVPDSLLDETLDDLPYLELFYKYGKGGYSLATAKQKPSKNDQLSGIEKYSPAVKSETSLIHEFFSNRRRWFKFTEEQDDLELLKSKGVYIFDDTGRLLNG